MFYYDRQGKPMTRDEWIARFEYDMPYKIVAQESGPNWSVSTVWVGINHQFGDGPPLIFETLAHWPGEGEYMARYATEDEAKAGHEAILALAKDAA